MGQPFIGEIRLFAGNFPPNGWMFCDGQLLPISENEALFTLIGTIYGGDGQETFALPNLQSRVPVHQGQGPGISSNYQLGESGGVEAVTLNTQQIPVHNHAQLASSALASEFSPGDKVMAQSQTSDIYIAGSPTVALQNEAITFSGGSQPHENVQPFLCINFIISLFGIFPRFS